MLAAHTWKRTGSSSKVTSPSSSLQPVLQRLGREDVGAGGDRPAHRAQRPVAVHLPAVLAGAAPQLGEPLDHGERRVPGDQGAVERADAGAEDEVGGDAALEERAQHADLDRAEGAPAAEDERGRHRGQRLPAADPGTASTGASWRTRAVGAVLGPEAQHRHGAAQQRHDRERQLPAGLAGQPERRDQEDHVEPAVRDPEVRGDPLAELLRVACPRRRGTSAGRRRGCSTISRTPTTVAITR